MCVKHTIQWYIFFRPFGWIWNRHKTTNKRSPFYFVPFERNGAGTYEPKPTVVKSRKTALHTGNVRHTHTATMHTHSERYARHTFAIWRAISFAQNREMHSCVFHDVGRELESDVSVDDRRRRHRHRQTASRKPCGDNTSTERIRVFAMQFVFIWWIARAVCQASLT